MTQLEINNLKMIKRLVTPWKRNYHLDSHSEDYVIGWNDAIKEVNSNYRKHVLPALDLFEREKGK